LGLPGGIALRKISDVIDAVIETLEKNVSLQATGLTIDVSASPSAKIEFSFK